MEAPNEPRAVTNRQSATHGLSDDISQTSRKMSEPNSLSSCTPGRSVSPEIHDQEPDNSLASVAVSHHYSDYDDSLLEGRQQQDYTEMSDLFSPQFPYQSAGSQASGFASPPEPLQSPPLIPPTVMPLNTPAPDYLQGSPHPLVPSQTRFPPFEMPRSSPVTARYQAHSYPANVSITQVLHQISHIDEAKVREILATAVVRHQDIHNAVATEYEMVARTAQEQHYEDTSILSFTKEHRTVQNLLYQEYDDFSNSKKHDIVQATLSAINQNILDILSHVRMTSDWRTKFNAFLTLVWIGRGIIDGRGKLPMAIRAQMALDSTFVQAIARIYDMMNHTEIMDNGAHLLVELMDLNKDREHCFEGLEKTVTDFRIVMLWQ